MDINGCSIPSNVVDALRTHYKDVVVKAGQAAVVYGRNSTEYALALALLTATVMAVKLCYGFKGGKDAHKFLAQDS